MSSSSGTGGNTITLALDAMGGDNAPEIVIDGAALALVEMPSLRFIIYGDEQRVLPLLKKHGNLHSKSKFIHTDDMVAAAEKPSVALRRGKNSSMRLAIDAVKSGEAEGVVSAGNTGALMAMSTIVLRTLKGISRPAIASIMPNKYNDILMLDLGANIECSVSNLVEFSIMGDAFAKTILKKKSPKISLLNIGSEDMKGHEEIKNTATQLAKIDNINFVGFVEGDDILNSEIDVIVCDGFTGNIALKTIEGTAKFIFDHFSNAFRSSIFGKIGAFVALPALRPLKLKLDPRRYNGAMFLGLNGVVIKSHGGTDAFGFSHAIKEAYDLLRFDVNNVIIEELRDSNIL